MSTRRADSEDFAVEYLAESRATVVVAAGDLDLNAAPAFSDALSAALRDTQGAVVMDLTEAAFMDSTGLTVVMDGFRQLGRAGRRFAVACRPGGLVHRLFDLTELLEPLEVHGSLQSALDAGDDRLRPSGRPAQEP